MNKFEVKLMKDSSEALVYDTPGVSLYIQTRNLQDYQNMRSFPHWHTDIEIMYIESGVLNFHVNGKTITLEKGHCCILNSRIMHYSSSVQKRNCTFTSILFQPELFTGNAILMERYILSVIKNPDFTYYYYPPDDPFHRVITDFVSHVTARKQSSPVAYELDILGYLHLFWSDFIRHHNLLESDRHTRSNPHQKLCQDMLSFIHTHYMDKITLDDIASSGNVSRSKCCELFRQYLNCSPVDFLNHYRLEISRKLLEDPSLSITDAAAYCGFSSCSYFIQQFRKTYGYTPGKAKLSSQHEKIKS